MKENLLSIKINTSIEKVFSFTINPENTHKWIDWIKKEYIEWNRVEIWTIYKNYWKDKIINSYILHNIINNELFHLKSLDSNYEVIYFYNKISENETLLNYYEFNSDWTDLVNPFNISTLQKLKNILEN